MNAPGRPPAAQAGLRRIERSAALPAPRFLYSPAVQAGSDVYISGLVGLDPASGRLTEGGAGEQTRRIFLNLRALCEEQGWPVERIVVARVYCAGREAADGMNQAWGEFFREIPPPARTFSVVESLPLGAAVEIEFQLSIQGDSP
ncbi:RidA family protein [Bordetella hinzii]|uniref:RidA family protein n=1 Tax=Bordetella hinzii TaxID=103855 RepID=UPI0013EFEBED|nr:RidA family protein [Bordetella hinzii]QII83902.1 RidA family protein [Bordetella hinzii]